MSKFRVMIAVGGRGGMATVEPTDIVADTLRVGRAGELEMLLYIRQKDVVPDAPEPDKVMGERLVICFAPGIWRSVRPLTEEAVGATKQAQKPTRENSRRRQQARQEPAG